MRQARLAGEWIDQLRGIDIYIKTNFYINCFGYEIWYSRKASTPELPAISRGSFLDHTWLLEINSCRIHSKHQTQDCTPSIKKRTNFNLIISFHLSVTRRETSTKGNSFETSSAETKISHLGVINTDHIRHYPLLTSTLFRCKYTHQHIDKI